ncbi:YeaH/YhbH family protein [Permianibacter sp. IMCC34836]|uniref:YeaH/YhbH family protein n=1 Tax=Permianibacter fluminis TaxID=2738515 RepID=UPI00155526D4|nr:YeaH/YhbH family protein [Permianibacter fluminis]NQD38755.1 YeaH/YhbH family protein [Permianibacter fluminis]
MSRLVDRRQWSKNKSTVNRQRFIRRFKSQIKKAVSEQLNKRSVTDLDTGENVSIPSKDTREPTFRSGQGGVRERIYPGNKEFVSGDRVKRPLNGEARGQGRRASDSGEGEDEFKFELSRDEYLDLLFEDLELPNLDIAQLRKTEQFRTVRAGYKTDGVPATLNIVRSLRGALARRMALSGEARSELRELEEKAKEHADEDDSETRALRARIEALRERIARVPFIDTFDLRFNAFVKQPVPTTQAVMFCLMDVSGSMDQATKDMAKRFFLLLYLFLTKTYKNVQVVFIRHHTQAKEVDEKEFFYSQETGGTVVSSALKLMDEIIRARYSPQLWNIYAAQASDGDNWGDDSPVCQDLLAQSILPQVRYFSYIEITQRNHQSLWEHYAELTPQFRNFAMQQIKEATDIYPIFRELFKRQKA